MNINITTTDPEHSADFYWKYTMTIAIGGNEPIIANCWKVATWLPRGASQDLDGSGLSNWGNSQPGGWRCLNQDSQEYGCPRVRFGYGDKDTDGKPVVTIRLRTDALSVRIRVPEGEDENDFGQRLENAIAVAAEKADVGEPDAEDVWGNMPTCLEMEGLPVRVGHLFGSDEIITAWETDDSYFFTRDSDPDSPDTGLIEAATDAFLTRYREAIAKAERNK